MFSSDELQTVTQDVVEQALRLLRDDIDKIILYGSYARGDFTSESDIDIMILLKCDKEAVARYRKQISQLSSRIGLAHDVEVSLLLRDKKSFDEGQDILPFYKNVKREGVILYG